jgi:NAD(P)-dependent dehydrogenase (short-subunit alcohol dehydrogenase family)
MKLAGRVAVITGAGNGIGQAIARTFAGEGASIVSADIDLSAAEATAAGLPTRAIATETEVGEYEACVAMIERAVEHFGRVDIMVNNAGVAPMSRFLELERAVFERVMAVNVSGALFCGQAAARDMATRNWGRIINVASISGQRAGLGRTAYGTSKAAVIQLTRQMAMELGALGITANAIAPGPVDTAAARAGHTPETREVYLRMIPVGRYGETGEMAAAALYLASEDAAYVNGHVLDVDGGFMAAGITFGDY